MPTGIYKRTDEHRRKITEGLIGHVSGMKGKRHSEESKRKIGDASKGHILSEESRKKISIGRIGKHYGPLSEKHKRSLSIAGKGNKHPGMIGHIPWNKGKHGHLQKETLKKMSESRKGVPHLNQRGEKSPSWGGGVTPKNKLLRSSLEFKKWRDKVFERDNYIDQKTGIRGGKLHPHHIQNFSSHPELRFDPDNGVTLSEKSHREFHKKYGKRNNTKEQLIEFLTNNYEKNT